MVMRMGIDFRAGSGVRVEPDVICCRSTVLDYQWPRDAQKRVLLGGEVG